MLENIAKTKEQIWNERFEAGIKKIGSQRKFISIYKAKYGRGSQADVSKWMHVGDVDGRTNKRRGFPTFETMRNIANVLGVSVGYLIGETDYETFDLERASKYLGLSSTSITAIRNITSGKAIPPFYKYPDEQRTAALEGFLENPMLVDYLKGICELAETISRKQKPKSCFEIAEKNIPEECREAAHALWRDSEEAIKEGVNPTKELLAYVKFLDDAAIHELYQSETISREINAARYSLQEIHVKMMDQFVAPERLSNLLPHYASREEVETMIKNSSKHTNTGANTGDSSFC